VQIRLLAPGDEGLLERASDEVFDHATRPDAVAEFLADPRHHVVVALEDGELVGFASGVHYVHPDKEPELWIAEVGVMATHRRRGVAKALVRALLDQGRGLGCREAWVLTERDNGAARALYGRLDGAIENDEVVMYSWRLDGG
jgi:GNAT superfamily N-acetyltransferase